MFRIFAASVRRIALRFYETGLLTLPHFFFSFLFLRARLGRISGVRCMTEKKFESDGKDGIRFEKVLVLVMENCRFAERRESLMIRANSCLLLTDDQRLTIIVNLLPMTLNK